jgi:hypothetical protein
MAEPFPPQGALGPTAPEPMPIPKAEQAWLSDRDLAQEATFLHVGGPLLVGGGLLPVGNGSLVRSGRNLLTEAEHASATRAARSLLERSRAGSDDASSADEIAAQNPDDPAIAYLRDNADALLPELATKQAKAAQELLDTYGSLAPLRSSPDEVAELLPKGAEARTDQARWVTNARAAVDLELEGLPPGVVAPLRERLATLADGTDPATWFSRSTELSDELLRARTKATDPEAAERLASAKQVVDEGLGQQTLWGAAANLERQRSAGYAKRYGDHIAAFEATFAADGKVDPTRLASLTDDDPATETLRRTLDSARVTADVAAKFGRKAEAQSMLRSIDALERSRRQARTVQTALQGVSRETDPAEDALAAIAQGALLGDTAAPQEAMLARLEARGGAFRAVAAITGSTRAAQRRGVQRLLSPASDDGVGDEDVPIAAPVAPRVNAVNFDATRDHIDRMARDPQYFASTMAASFGTLPESAPELFQAVAAQTAKVVGYLSAVAPGGASGGPFGQRFPVGDDELWEFNERVMGAADPEHIPARLEQGSLSSQAIEAFQVMNPRAYSQLRIDVFERLQELKEQGVPVSMQAREQIDTLLDIDGGGDPALTWKVAERVYAAQARRLPSATRMDQGSGDASAGAMTSGALSTLGNGASAIAQT